MRRGGTLDSVASTGLAADRPPDGSTEAASGKGRDEDAEIIATLEKGDRHAALELLMRAHGERVHGYCRRFLNDEQLADDVHQQVFAQAYFDLPRYQRRSSTLVWLTGIAHHRCLDALKGSRRSLRRAHLVEAVPERPDSQPLADERVAAAEIATAFRACLALLQAAARAAVTLRL